MGTASGSLRQNGRAVGVRLDPEVYERLEGKARRRKTTVTEYCRDLLSRHVQDQNDPEPVTLEKVHDVALRALEDLQVVMQSHESLFALFPDQANAEVVKDGQSIKRGHRVVKRIDMLNKAKRELAQKRLQDGNE